MCSFHGKYQVFRGKLLEEVVILDSELLPPPTSTIQGQLQLRVAEVNLLLSLQTE